MLLTWLGAENTSFMDGILDPLLSESRRIAMPGAALEILDAGDYLQVVAEYCENLGYAPSLESVSPNLIKVRSAYAARLSLNPLSGLSPMKIKLLKVRL